MRYPVSIMLASRVLNILLFLKIRKFLKKYLLRCNCRIMYILGILSEYSFKLFNIYATFYASVSNIKYLMISTVIECAIAVNNLRNYETSNIRGFCSRTYRDMETRGQCPRVRPTQHVAKNG